MSKHLSGSRKQRNHGFKIQLKGLLQTIPNDVMIFENAKHHPMFPILVLYVYMKNKHVHDAFHQRYPTYPHNETVLNGLLQQDEMWVDKYNAGTLYSDLSIRFTTSFPQTHIVFSINFDHEVMLFRAELTKNAQILSTIACPCQGRKTYIDLKLSIIAMLLMTCEYDKTSLIRVLTNELNGFTLLVPDFVEQFIAIFVSPKRIGEIVKEFKANVSRFKKSEMTLTTILFQNLGSWPFNK